MAVTDEQFEALEERVTALETNLNTITTTLGTLVTSVSDLTSAVEALQEAQVDTFPLSHTGQTVQDAITLVNALTIGASDINAAVEKYNATGFLKNREGSVINSTLSNAYSVFTALSTPQRVLTATNNAYPLVLKWGVRTHSYTFTENGSIRFTGTVAVTPSVLAGTSVLAVCDFANTAWDGSDFRYTVDGNNMSYTLEITHGSDSSQRGDFTFKIYWIAVAKNAGGGSVG